MISRAILKYTFEFDPSETWSTLGQFEKTLVSVFDAMGLVAEFPSVLGAQSIEKYIFVSKKIITPVAEPPKVQLKDNLKNLRNPQTYKYPNSYK